MNTNAEHSPVEVLKHSQRTAGLMRWLGAFAVAASAAVFMLQGLASIELDLRNWMYLALMGVMAGFGVASSKLMQDAKSTRLFFGLAALLVPVQFSQLGGLIHELSTVPETFVPHLPWLLLGTLVLASAVSYTAMAILDRTNKRALSIALVSLSAALLLPYRASSGGFVLLGAMAAVVFLLRIRLLRTDAQSLEQKGMRLILMAPVVIAAVRMTMHIETVAGFATLGGLVALILSRVDAASGLVRMFGALLGVTSWLVYAIDVVPGSTSGTWATTILYVPASAWLMYVASSTKSQSSFAQLASKNQARAYRVLACLLYGFSAGALLMVDSPTTSATLLQMVALAQGALAIAWGVLYNHREPTLMGALITASALAVITVTAIGNVEVSSWVVLGVAGVCLVFGASVLEKHGRRLAARTRTTWQTVRAWQ